VRLETERLILAPHRVADFDALAAMWADPGVVDAIGLKPSTRCESWMRLLRYGGLWPLLGFGYWAVRERASGRFVGDVGFADFHREVEPSIRGVPEAGWVLAAWAHGQGFGREAMMAALAWLDGQRQHSVCLVGPGHTRSLRLAAGLGYAIEETTRLNGEETLLLSRTAISATKPGLPH
jgi:RimJ/RimL family protein N-acetyltransferase